MNSEKAPLETTKSSSKVGKRILLIVGIVILAVLLVVGGISLAFLHRLRGNENVPIVDRPEPYTREETKEESVSILTPNELETIELVTEEETEEIMVPDSTDKTDNAAEGKQKTDEPVPIWRQKKTDPNVINILLLGRDSRNPSHEYGRTDSMIILSYNKKTHGVKLISLMRDMLIPIEGHDWNRINTAYAFGGIGFCINTINDVFDLDIQNYMTIDFNGLISVVDSVGGIDLNLTPDEVALYQAYGKMPATASAGINHLDGSFALTHARNRALGSDFERTRRQRDILIAIFQRVTSSLSLSEVTSLVSSTLNMVSTNLPAADLISMATDVMTNKDSISFTTSRLPYNGTYQSAWYKKMLVIDIDIEENTRLLHETLYGD